MAHTTTTANPISRDRARITLGMARLVFGTLGLLAPRLLIRRIQGPGTNSPAAVYAFRMFGIRTVLIGKQLLAPDGPNRREALRVAPIIHGADTATATLLTVRGHVPKRTGLSLIAVSGFNTAMALLALPRAQQQGRPKK
jgi:hypothetical protein